MKRTVVPVTKELFRNIRGQFATRQAYQKLSNVKFRGSKSGGKAKISFVGFTELNTIHINGPTKTAVITKQPTNQTMYNIAFFDFLIFSSKCKISDLPLSAQQNNPWQDKQLRR